MRAVAQETELAGVVTQPDRPAGRGHKLTPTPVKKAAMQYGVPIYEPASLKDFASNTAALPCELFVLASYGKILPAALLALPQKGALNVHPSLLPKYRGATPLQAALLAGDSQTGVSIMMMDAGMDTGPLLMQERTPVGPQETYGELHDRLAEMGAQLLRTALREIAAGTAAAWPQQGEASTTKPVRKEDLQIDWNQNVESVANMVRAYSPQPAARAVLQGVPVKIVQAQRGPDADALPVACADGDLWVTRLIVPNKGAISGAAFAQYAKTHTV